MRVIVIVGFAGLLAGAAACAGRSTPARERARNAREGTGPIVVGAPWDWGRNPQALYRQGLELAVEEVNAGHGIRGRKLQLRMVEDSGSVERARLLAQQLVDDPTVLAVIGHHQSFVTAAAAGVYETGGLVLVSPTATSPALTGEGYRYVFQSTFTDLDVAREMARFAMARQCRRLAVYYTRDDHGRALANAFESFLSGHGGEVVARASTDPARPLGPDALADVVVGWRERPFDAVFLATGYAQAAAMAAQLRKGGFEGPLYGTDAIPDSAYLVEGGPAAEGTIYATAFNGYVPRPEVQHFLRAFRGRFGRDPDMTAALGYDAVQLLARAMRHSASVLPDSVANALHAARDWPGATSVFTFTASGRLQGPVVNIAIVRGGRFQGLADAAAAPACAAPTPASAPAS